MPHITSVHILLAKNNMKYTGKCNCAMFLDIVAWDTVGDLALWPASQKLGRSMHQKLTCSSQVLHASSPLPLLIFFFKWPLLFSPSVHEEYEGYYIVFNLEGKVKTMARKLRSSPGTRMVVLFSYKHSLSHLSTNLAQPYWASRIRWVQGGMVTDEHSF